MIPVFQRIWAVLEWNFGIGLHNESGLILPAQWLQEKKIGAGVEHMKRCFSFNRIFTEYSLHGLALFGKCCDVLTGAAISQEKAGHKFDILTGVT